MEQDNYQNKISKMLEEKKKKLDENSLKMVGLNEQNAKLQEEIRGLEEQMTKIVNIKQNEKPSGQKRKLIDAEVGQNSGKKLSKSSIRRRPMPAELKNELFGALPFENAFAILAKMPDGLLARNVQKMFNGIKIASKNNKWNVADCGPMMEISDDGLIVTFAGANRCNSVRAIMPIPALNVIHKKPSIAFYFEVHSLTIPRRMYNHNSSYAIGFTCEEFSLKNRRPGNVNSIGFGSGYTGKGGFWIDGNRTLNVQTNLGSVVGIGILHSKANSLKCFVTCNGKLFGVSDLPPKFATLKLFPTICLGTTDQSIRANFGKEEWRFKDFKHAFEYTTRKSSRLN